MKILVIEDDARVSELLQRGLMENGYEVTPAYDGVTGIKLAAGQNFDLVITDIVLPGHNGLDVCREIRRKSPEIPIIMLTALGTTDDKVDGFESGADDYLVKPFDFRELLVRIQALLKRNSGSSVRRPDLMQYHDLSLDRKTKIVKRAGREIKLTPKEFRLLEYMLSHPERVLSRMEISENVWDTTFDTGTNFIDVYINYLRKKIDRDFDTRLIHTRQGMGFVLKKTE